MTECSIRFDGDTYDFDETPTEPLKACGKIWTMGWDIPTYWSVDGFNQCWASCGHGTVMSKTTPDILFNECKDSPHIEAQVRQALGRKPKYPTWIAEAKAAGWTPPADWDESKYDVP